MRRQTTLRRFAAMRRQAAVRLLAAVGLLMLLGGAAGLGWSLRPLWRGLMREARSGATAVEPARGLARPAAAVSTAGGQIWLPVVSSGGDSAVEEITGQAEPQAALAQLPTATLPVAPLQVAPQAIDEWAPLLSAGEKVVLRIAPPEAVGNGREIKIAFRPADECAYGSGQGCVSRHRGGQVTLLTVHSGLGGEGEAFRSAMEGTGLDLAFYPFAQIQRNMRMLSGSPARIQAGSQRIDDLTLAAVARVPPVELAEYFQRPFDDSLAEAAANSPELQAALESGEPLLIFEICGWQIPGEAWAPDVSPTTASIYLGAVKIK